MMQEILLCYVPSLIAVGRDGLAGTFSALTASLSGVMRGRGISTNSQQSEYHKVPKFSDSIKLSCKHSKTQTKKFYCGVIPPIDRWNSKQWRP